MKKTGNSEKKLEKLNDYQSSAGFVPPSELYFEQFCDSLPLDNAVDSGSWLKLTKTIFFKASTSAIAAILLISIWVFVFNSEFKIDAYTVDTIEELISLDDFQYFNEDLIYSEMIDLPGEFIYDEDEELELLLSMEEFSIQEFIEINEVKEIK